ncbi:7066_t:CDS:2, partial [Dentiscutata erythropus]
YQMNLCVDLFKKNSDLKITAEKAIENLITKIEDGSLCGFSNNIQENLSNSNWWKKLQNLYKLVEPYCTALNKLQNALAKQEKKIRETNVAIQAQYTNLENEDYSDNNNGLFNLSSDDDLYIEDESNELNESDSDIKSDEFKNHIRDIQNINNWRYLVSW